MTSSQEVDIIEISNSLDNDFPSQVDPFSVNEASTKNHFNFKSC
jgi:hypothetical protein